MFCPNCGDKIEPNEKYCNKCGNYLGNITSQATPTEYSNVEYRQIENEKKTNITNKWIIIGIGGVAAVFLSVVIAIFVVIFNSSKYYYTTQSYENTQVSTSAQNSTTINNSNTSSKGKYTTSVVYDNVYTNMEIEDEEDAYNLIVEDSVNQKAGSYPTDVKKVEESIISDLEITAVNLKEMDSDFAQELENVFKKIYEEYPSVRGYITNLSLVNTGLSEQYIAAFMPAFIFATSNTQTEYPWVIKTQVLLNAAYFLNPERLDASVKDGSESGHFPKNTTIYSPVAHELGHYLSYLAMMNYYDVDSILLVDNDNINKFYALCKDFSVGDFSYLMVEEAYQNYINDTSDTVSIDDWRGTISSYALSKDNSGNYIYDETIAEAFHDTYLNGDNAAIASKYVVEVLKKYLEE